MKGGGWVGISTACFTRIRSICDSLSRNETGIQSFKYHIGCLLRVSLRLQKLFQSWLLYKVYAYLKISLKIFPNQQRIDMPRFKFEPYQWCTRGGGYVRIPPCDTRGPLCTRSPRERAMEAMISKHVLNFAILVRIAQNFCRLPWYLAPFWS